MSRCSSRRTSWRAFAGSAFKGMQDTIAEICRPVGLSPGDVKNVLSQAIGQLGCAYDTRNIIDLARYLFPTPPVPASWRREMIAFGSGDPTRAICSELIAQSFEAVGYPVLPDVTYLPAPLVDCPDCVEQIMRVHHHSLYVPRDFDVSPYFEIVKPSLEAKFDFHILNWARAPAPAQAPDALPAGSAGGEDRAP